MSNCFINIGRLAKDKFDTLLITRYKNWLELSIKNWISKIEPPTVIEQSLLNRRKYMDYQCEWNQKYKIQNQRNTSILSNIVGKLHDKIRKSKLTVIHFIKKVRNVKYWCKNMPIGRDSAWVLVCIYDSSISHMTIKCNISGWNWVLCAYIQQLYFVTCKCNSSHWCPCRKREEIPC